MHLLTYFLQLLWKRQYRDIWYRFLQAGCPSCHPTSKQQNHKLIRVMEQHKLITLHWTDHEALTKRHADKQSYELISHRDPPQVLVLNDDTESEADYWALPQNHKYMTDHCMVTDYCCCNTTLSDGLWLHHLADGHPTQWPFWHWTRYQHPSVYVLSRNPCMIKINNNDNNTQTCYWHQTAKARPVSKQNL